MVDLLLLGVLLFLQFVVMSPASGVAIIQCIREVNLIARYVGILIITFLLSVIRCTSCSRNCTQFLTIEGAYKL